MIRTILPGNIASSKGTTLPYVIFSLSPNKHNTQKALRRKAEGFLCLQLAKRPVIPSQ